MRGVPLFVVAVLTAMVSTAVAVRGSRVHYARVDPEAPKAGDPASPRGPGDPVRDASAPPPDARAPVADGWAPIDSAAPPAVAGPRMFHGDARRTDRAPGHAPLVQPRVAWSADVGGPVEAQVVASPDGRTLYVASLGGSLTALARADGSTQWRLSFGDRAYATPAVADDGTIYAGSDAQRFVAVTPEGKVRWSFDTDGEVDTGAALAGDGTIVFAAGQMVYGLSPQGYPRFRFGAKRKVFTAPALGDGGRVFFGSQDHHAYALTSQGALLWSADLGADVDGGPAIADDGAVFVGTDAGEVVRLDPVDGHVVWRANAGGFVRGSLSIARNGDVLAGVYGPNPRALRLRAADGAEVADFAIAGTGAREFGVHGGALEDEAGGLLFGAQDNDVRATDSSGRLRWRFTTGADVDAPVTLLDDGEVVVGSDDGKVYLLRGR